MQELYIKLYCSVNDVLVLALAPPRAFTIDNEFYSMATGSVAME